MVSRDYNSALMSLLASYNNTNILLDKGCGVNSFTVQHYLEGHCKPYVYRCAVVHTNMHIVCVGFAQTIIVQKIMLILYLSSCLDS